MVSETASFHLKWTLAVSHCTRTVYQELVPGLGLWSFLHKRKADYDKTMLQAFYLNDIIWVNFPSSFLANLHLAGGLQFFWVWCCSCSGGSVCLPVMQAEVFLEHIGNVQGWDVCTDDHSLLVPILKECKDYEVLTYPTEIVV